MPRYEFSEGKSNKFWTISLNGTSFSTRYGKIGSEGSTTSKSFATAAAAKAAYDKLVAEKVKKGYVLVDPEAGVDDDGEFEELEE
jgi:predicted DNA-binding WGR domain protein